MLGPGEEQSIRQVIKTIGCPGESIDTSASDHSKSSFRPSTCSMAPVMVSSTRSPSHGPAVDDTALGFGPVAHLPHAVHAVQDPKSELDAIFLMSGPRTGLSTKKGESRLSKAQLGTCISSKPWEGNEKNSSIG